MNYEGLVAELVKYGAPVLASLLGSPIAGSVVALLANHFTGGNTNIQSIINSLASNPEQLKQLENEHKEAILKMLLGFVEESESKLPIWVIVIMVLAILTVIGIYLAMDMGLLDIIAQ